MTRSIQKLAAGKDDFPTCLSSIPFPPQILYLRGQLPKEPMVAVVGSRESDEYGLGVAQQMGAQLAQAGVNVVSGGAGGVDTAALQGCLQAGGSPVAVLGTGVDIVYPATNRRLFVKIAEVGALLSEYPPGTPGRPAHFPQRPVMIEDVSLIGFHEPNDVFEGDTLAHTALADDGCYLTFID